MVDSLQARLEAAEARVPGLEAVVEAARALSTYESLVASGDLARTKTVDVLHRNVLRDALAALDAADRKEPTDG